MYIEHVQYMVRSTLHIVCYLFCKKGLCISYILKRNNGKKPKAHFLEGEERNQIEEQGRKEDFSGDTLFHSFDFGCMEMFYFSLKTNNSALGSLKQDNPTLHTF